LLRRHKSEFKSRNRSSKPMAATLNANNSSKCTRGPSDVSIFMLRQSLKEQLIHFTGSLKTKVEEDIIS
jgi:hypothetical protein